ncbi:hypothetical protein [Mesorhizobium sp. B2-1-5]|uniref:hypothetical protein n=1 Tax=Mesorhizobium sp. B2-1-5 TaxID=2589969 RepID=UPI001FEFD76D|nr:hypothetical protein [Mesorhizobium sp. B2-1-5]
MTSRIDATRDLMLSDTADLIAAASAARELYGPDAATAVVYCAMEAHFAGRTADFHFWFDVFRDLIEPKAH